MIDLDDLVPEEPLEDVYIQQEKITSHVLNEVQFGTPIVYSHIRKNFWVTYGTPLVGDEIPMGISVGYDKYSGLTDVLYKGFLYINPIEIPNNISLNHIDTYVMQVYNRLLDKVKAEMPRIRRLKRMNLKIPNRTIIKTIYDKFDAFMDGYSSMFGTTASQMFKAQFVTTPFYAVYNNNLKVYKFETNEYYDCDDEGANFIPYFTFQNL